ncbi:outer membrane protein assembly factor BamD [Thermotomaculum hydrothermale]|uniref:Outer membrane protein assembly factor BamD n=1 Tax=Thermotomaculum hydrothermale TaxID=981385 RepID=A0A7R6PYG8_9BACT|nr:outer membrane protein assembly factor BamD [Thermotomaculum hydrothermale]BBB33170.1 outer membrane protein assembly factor BamD [Thermotomaculum hydrothermale]
MKKIIIGLLVFILLFFNACKSAKEANIERAKKISVSKVYLDGMEYLLNKNYSSARDYFEVIIDNATQSEYFPYAKLAYADALFFDVSKGPIEALPEYQSFIVYFPKHKETPYAQFMVAMCYFVQINGPDRDQTYVDQAMAEFEKLKSNYPDSKYAQMADKYIDYCWKIKAQHEYLVGVFYYKVKGYKAAADRLRGLIENYDPKYYDKEKAYYYFARSLMYETKFDEAARYFRKLLKEFPNTIYRDSVKEQLDYIESGKAEKELKERKKKIEEKYKKELEKRIKKAKGKKKKSKKKKEKAEDK